MVSIVSVNSLNFEQFYVSSSFTNNTYYVLPPPKKKIQDVLKSLTYETGPEQPFTLSTTKASCCKWAVQHLVGKLRLLFLLFILLPIAE